MAVAAPGLAMSLCSGCPSSLPSESPTMSTRSGLAALGCKKAGTVEVVELALLGGPMSGVVA